MGERWPGLPGAGVTDLGVGHDGMGFIRSGLE